MIEKIYFDEGGDNVFADLGVRDPEDAALRADLAEEIAKIITSGGLSQTETARILGIDQPKVSKLVRGRISGFTSDRLFRFLTALGCDVRIQVTRKAAGNAARGKLVVEAA